MEGFAQIRPLPPSLCVYEPSGERFQFSNLETESANQWLTLGEAFPVPQADIHYCVILSGTSVTTTCATMMPFSTGIDARAAAINTAMEDLRAVVSAIRDARPVSTLKGLDDLLTRAAKSQGSPRNVEEWARRLAADIGELAD